MIKRVLPIIHSLHTRCHDFQFSCTDRSIHLTADLQVVMVFQKKEEKNPKNPNILPPPPNISIWEKQNNPKWDSNDATCKSCEQSCLCP